MSSTEPPDATGDVVEAEVALDVDRDALVLGLRDELGDAVLDAVVVAGVDVWVRVDRRAWVQAAEACRDRLGLRYFCFLSAIDWLPSPFGRAEGQGVDLSRLAGAETVPMEQGAVETVPMEQGVAGGETRFQLLARLSSPTTQLGLTLKADVPDDDLRVDTWSGVYAGADWHERETAEMYGIEFVGHPHPAHIYLPGDFEGYPLRKDFPLVARLVKPWPGIVDVEAMPGEPVEEVADVAADGTEASA